MTNAEANQVIAESIGDKGFWPAETCPQGHYHARSPRIGSLCVLCVDVAARAWCAARGYEMQDWALGGNELSWLRDKKLELSQEDHPEWQIQRGKPRNYCDSLSELIPVVQEWCDRKKMRLTRDLRSFWTIRAFNDSPSQPIRYRASFDGIGDFAYADTPDEALAHAYAACLVQTNS